MPDDADDASCARMGVRVGSGLLHQNRYFWPEVLRLVSMDSRPSDSIALALQAGAALFVAKDLARCLTMQAVSGERGGFGSLQAVTCEFWV